MESRKQGFDNGLITLFHKKFNHSEVKFGTVTIPPGGRVPVEGLSVHEENEYSFIVSGELEGESGGKSFKVNGSEATFIEAGEEHWALNSGDEDCQIVFALVKEK